MEAETAGGPRAAFDQIAHDLAIKHDHVAEGALKYVAQ
jgi:hypothetical protein